MATNKLGRYCVGYEVCRSSAASSVRMVVSRFGEDCDDRCGEGSGGGGDSGSFGFFEASDLEADGG